MSDKTGLYEGIGYFLTFLGLALCLFSIGWCHADFPGLNCEKSNKVVETLRSTTHPER